ncbi:hypothetical protein BCF33_2575 [Hasllibacter halocynthiae]|uniref:Uncharacterized protein n=1 Tax=Hasllibacter halocynthiae TaxID=595589 RepID=A0A2T0X417_9RHOB|nr:hypothetical protein [Hasllibacter halocynthiae]PRY93693.1 hypothetical protein BCF33_2575 [Hasllibacter halocynthiae]
MRRALISITFLLALAGCARQACLDGATRELRRVESLLAESETALARGYREETVLARGPVAGFTLCASRDVAGLCVGQPAAATRTRAVAIDPAAERRTRDNLRTRVSQLRREASRAVAACPA